MGSSLFFLYALPRAGPWAASGRRWPCNLLALSAAALLLGSVFGLIGQTGLLAGSFAEGFKLSNLQAVVTQMNFGWANIIRAVMAGAILLSIFVAKPSTSLWSICAIAGTVACGSFAWMGHGAATEGGAGYVHLVADIAHSLAAAVWIGALVNLTFLLSAHARLRENDRVICESLVGFSGIGSAAVAVLVVSGVVNSWFLIGIDRLTDFWTTLYGQVLSAKLVVFGGMVLLAASNRYFLTPHLEQALSAGSSQAKAIIILRRSLFLETLAAITVLALVAWLGTLPPANVQ